MMTSHPLASSIHLKYRLNTMINRDELTLATCSVFQHHDQLGNCPVLLLHLVVDLNPHILYNS